MPSNRYTDLQNDQDHVSKQNQDKKVVSQTYPPAKPSDLGTGAAKNAAESIVKRKKMLEDL